MFGSSAEIHEETFLGICDVSELSYIKGNVRNIFDYSANNIYSHTFCRRNKFYFGGRKSLKSCWDIFIVERENIY